jgi:hypothetical protein
MKLSEATIEMLKGFSAISQSLLLKKGKTQRTICSDKIILAEAEFDEEMPINFGIYDLNVFLANLALMKNPELEFSDKNVIMKNPTDNWKLVFSSCSPTVIESPPDKQLLMDSVDVKLTMSAETIQKIARMSQINAWDSLAISGENGKLMLLTSNTTNNDAGSLSRVIGDYEGQNFKATFKVSNLRIIPDDYDVEIMLNRFAKFISKNKPIRYFIALETTKD